MSGYFEAGAEFVAGSRTITDAEVAFLPSLMGATNALFHDEVTAAAGPMGGRVLYGPALLGISVALSEPLLSERVRALMGIDAIRFRRPVHPGDTVTARFTVRDCAERQGKPGFVLQTEDEVRNQDDEVVLRFERTILISHN